MSYENIPAELRSIPQWVGYMLLDNPSKGKPDKVPVNPHALRGASSTNPQTWGTLEQAAAQIGKTGTVSRGSGRIEGIGFVFNNNGLVGVDFDNCFNDQGQIDETVAEWVRRFDSYTEFSQSGKGLHIICKATLGDRKAIKQPEVEIYDRARYFIVTGMPYGDTKPLRDAQTVLDMLYTKHSVKPTQGTQGGYPLDFDAEVYNPQHSNATGKNYLEIGLDKDRGFRSLWDGNRTSEDESSADQSLMNKLAYWCNCDKAAMLQAFRRSPHFHQKDPEHTKKANRPDYLPRTADCAIKDCKQTAENDDLNFQDRRRTSAAHDFAGISTCNTQNFIDIFRPVADFEETEAQWLVSGWIPTGQVALLASDGGVGKTTVVCDIAASLSSGKACIFDLVGTVREPKRVLILTTEDSISKKLKKKLRLLGANQENIIAPDPALDTNNDLRKLKFGSPLLAEVIRKFKPDLCVLDPVQGYVPPDINMGARNAMRDCMASLTSLGEETGCTFLVVCHSNKRKGASGRERISDSADLWDIARSVIMAGFTSDGDIRYLSNEKNNYAKLQDTVLFRINEKGLPERTGSSQKRDRDFVQESYFAVKEKEPINEKLVSALKDEANPFEPVKFSYSSFEEKHGALIWGGKGCKKALDSVKPTLERDGYSLVTKSVKIDGKSANGFILQMVDVKQEQLTVRSWKS